LYMNRFQLERVIGASLKTVWDAADFTKSVGPYPMEMRTPGDPENHCIGYTRAVTSGRRTIIERLLSVDPMKFYTYTMVEGVPVKDDYLGKVEFAQRGNSTKITWTVSFSPKYFGTGWIGAFLIKRTVSKIVDAIENESRAV